MKFQAKQWKVAANDALKDKNGGNHDSKLDCFELLLRSNVKHCTKNQIYYKYADLYPYS